MKKHPKNETTKPGNAKLCSLLIPLILAYSAFSPPNAFGVVPAPDGSYPGFNTAEGDKALFSLTTGVANTANGWFSLFSNTDGSFNTAVGAGTLLFNVGDQSTGDGLANTAIGTAALLFNATGNNNTAVGAGALVNNDGDVNTAIGAFALNSNTTGFQNTATGSSALASNSTGFFNTATGAGALFSNTTGSDNTATGTNALPLNTEGNSNTADGVAALANNVTGQLNTAIGASALLNNTIGNANVALGVEAGADLTDNNNIDIGFQVRGLAGESNTIRIGDNLPQGGQSNCYIGGIFGSDIGDGLVVGANADNKVGTFITGAAKVRVKDVIQNHKKVAELEATVAALTTQIKEQAEQIQKVSAQVEMNKPPKKMVLNNP